MSNNLKRVIENDFNKELNLDKINKKINRYNLKKRVNACLFIFIVCLFVFSVNLNKNNKLENSDIININEINYDSVSDIGIKMIEIDNNMNNYFNNISDEFKCFMLYNYSNEFIGYNYIKNNMNIFISNKYKNRSRYIEFDYNNLSISKINNIEVYINKIDGIYVGIFLVNNNYFDIETRDLSELIKIIYKVKN